MSRSLLDALNKRLTTVQQLATLAESRPTSRSYSSWPSDSHLIRSCGKRATQANAVLTVGIFNRQLAISKSFASALSRPRNLLHRPLVFQASQHSGFTSQSEASTASDGVRVRFDGDHVLIELRIPGSSERRRFVFRRYADRLSDLCDAIRAECGGKKFDIQLRTATGERLAASTQLGVALGVQNDSLRFVVSGGDHNEPIGEVAVLIDASSTGTATERVEQLRSTVASLYEMLNVPGFRKARREALERELTELRGQVKPLEIKRAELEIKSRRSGKRLVWFGMGYMGVQAGVLARLTWWEYSWDIVEPISYFVTYATSMVFFAYYLLTRQEWSFPAVEDRHIMFKLHSLADRHRFDTKRYNSLKQRILDIEEQLRHYELEEQATSYSLDAGANASASSQK